MNIRSFVLTTICLAIAVSVSAQSKTTEALEKEHPGTRTFFFYKNTLRMINQTADPAFDELIKDIEKMKLLMISKTSDKFSAGSYKKIVSDYKADRFEEVMTSRFDGKNFDIFFKGDDNKTEGMLVLVNDAETLFVLDILGKINVNRVTELYKTLDSSSDIGQQIKNFTNQNSDRNKSGKSEEKDN